MVGIYYINGNGGKMKKNILVALVVLLVLVLAGCGSDNKADKGPDQKVESTQKKEEKTSNALSDQSKVFSDAAVAEALKVEIKEKIGSAKVFEEIQITENLVTFSYQDPNKATNVDAYKKLNGSWSGPNPVKITLSGGKTDDKEALARAITNSSWNIDEFDFKMIPKIMEDAKNKAKEKGIEDPKVDKNIIIGLSLSNKRVIQIGVKGTRGNATYRANMDGSFESLN